jgi:predicted phage-related endonuclease
VTREFSVVDAPQRSPEWFTARLGRLTGSRAADMLATIRTGEAAARRDLRLQLVVERLTQTVQDDGFVSPAMERGTLLEPAAFAAYEALTGALVTRTGFLAHDSLAVGTSLDGHVGDFEGCLEIKCPKSATHIGYLRAGVVPAAYVPQMTHHLWVTGAAWCDFLSYDDRLPAALQTFLVRLTRDEAAIAAYRSKAVAFLAEVDAEFCELAGIQEKAVA